MREAICGVAALRVLVLLGRRSFFQYLTRGDSRLDVLRLTRLKPPELKFFPL